MTYFGGAACDSHVMLEHTICGLEIGLYGQTIKHCESEAFGATGYVINSPTVETPLPSRVIKQSNIVLRALPSPPKLRISCGHSC